MTTRNRCLRVLALAVAALALAVAFQPTASAQKKKQAEEAQAPQANYSKEFLKVGPPVQTLVNEKKWAEVLAALPQFDSLPAPTPDDLKAIATWRLQAAQGAGDAIKGIYGTANWDWQLPDEATKAFTKSFGAEFGTPPSQAAHTGYVQALLYANACETAGTFNPEGVVKALEGFEFDGLGNGPTLYRAEDHQCFKPVLVVQGKEKPADKFDLLQVVQEVPTEQVTYDASIFGGELGPVNSKC